MATYTELFELRNDAGLRNKVAVAVAKKAQLILDTPGSTAAQVTWASSALEVPMQKATSILHYVLMANSAASVAQIQNASDASIQSNVDAAVDAIVAGGV